MTNKNPEGTALRRRWMGVLSRAERPELERAWDQVADKPDYSLLRPPQTGLAMVRGRVGGGGRRFNLGEMTLTRCAVSVRDGAMGLGYVGGRDVRKAELAAVFDAMLQDEDRRETLMQRVIAPLTKAQSRRRAEVRAETAPTRVDFFTMVRGED